VRALAHGKNRKELARELAICYTTLSRHLYNIQMKMGAQSAEQMVYLAVKQGLID
jgi:DNA-binding NarL/FixJ family response regulator